MEQVPQDVIEVLIGIEPTGEDGEPSISVMNYDDGDDWMDDDYDDDSDEGGEDWEMLCRQLLEAVALMDTETDAALSGDMSYESAVQAIDNMTSRILWGDQEEDNPDSSFQNESYEENAAIGMMMEDDDAGDEDDLFAEEDDRDE